MKISTLHQAATAMTARSWVFTIFGNLVQSGADLYQDYEAQDVRYIVWQREIAPDTQQAHLQGYVEFTKPKRLRAVKQALGSETAHVEPRRGTRDQARDYARKEETREAGPWERGEWIVGRGERRDLDAIHADLQAGGDLRTISNEYFGQYIRYHRGIQHWRLLNTDRRSWKPEVIVIHGPTGTGKTQAAWLMAPSAYVLPPQQASSGVGWWCGYDLHADVIIDEFYGWLRYNFMLQLLDRYPLRLETKGGSVECVARRFILTSNKAPEQWYDTDKHPYPPLYRRISSIYFADQDVFYKQK